MHKRLESLKANLEYLAGHPSLAQDLDGTGLGVKLKEQMETLQKKLEEAAGDPQKMADLMPHLEALEKEMAMGKMIIQEDYDKRMDAMELEAKWRKRMHKIMLNMI